MGPARVQGLWRYPVKSTRGEVLVGVACTKTGLDGDRQWGVMRADGTVVSAKNPKHGGSLLEVASRWLDDGTTVLALPSGGEVVAGDVAADLGLTHLLGEPVRLSKTPPPDLHLHRLWPTQEGLIPEWQRQSRPDQLETTAVAGSARGAWVDYGPIHILTVGAVHGLERQLDEPLDISRLRPNLLLGLAVDPERGQTLHIGEDLVLRVDLPTPRCIVPSLAQGNLPRQPSLLQALATHYRREVHGLGRAACFGFYAEVLQPGVAALDDVVVIDARRSRTHPMERDLLTEPLPSGSVESVTTAGH